MSIQLKYVKRAEVEIVVHETTLGQLLADLQKAQDYGIPNTTVVEDVDVSGPGYVFHFVDQDEQKGTGQ